MSIPKLRQSQVVTTYGPGALVDLPDHSILIAGLDHWRGKTRQIHEARLVENLKGRLRMPGLELRAPPVPESDLETDVGVVGWQFPEWFASQYERSSKEHGRSRPLVHRSGLKNGRWPDPDGKVKRGFPVVPVRFVMACPNGHLSDIPWSQIVHGAGVGCGGQLWLDERGTTGDLAELFVRCDGCKAKPISLVQLQTRQVEAPVLGRCKGHRPWLGPAAKEECKGDDGKAYVNRLLIRHASNAYFPIVERAISLPDRDERVRKAVDVVWDDFLSSAETLDEMKAYRKNKRVVPVLEGMIDAEVWKECQRRRGSAPAERRGLKTVELDTLLAQPEELGEDVPDGDFYARRLILPAAPVGPMANIERVVLVHRLREVVVELGFTRFESPVVPVDDEVDLGVRIAPLALEERWLPAVENRGEGVFIALQPEAVRAWIQRPAVAARAKAFRAGLAADGRELPFDQVLNTYMPYVLLHSLSHLLLTAIALECGYAAASIRERVYVRDGAYAILLYTGTPDAEGTLGGLVQVGRRLEQHLKAALELGALCSNDPVCAHHSPSHVEEARYLHGAACHGCLLIAEPSCERRNELLDRALVVPTVETGDTAFFTRLR